MTDHWNNPAVLPPVDCPIIIRRQVWIDHPTADQSGYYRPQMLDVTRTKHIENKERDMTYRLEDGTEIVGRFEWQYP